MLRTISNLSHPPLPNRAWVIKAHYLGMAGEQERSWPRNQEPVHPAKVRKQLVRPIHFPGSISKIHYSCLKMTAWTGNIFRNHGAEFISLKPWSLGDFEQWSLLASTQLQPPDVNMTCWGFGLVHPLFYQHDAGGD